MKELDYSKMLPCQLPHIKLSCWGCCGDEFQSKKEVENDIKINTYEFNLIKNPSVKDLIDYKTRFHKDPNALTPSGICSNLVNFGDGCYACPIHPKINDVVPKEIYTLPKEFVKKDIRINYCADKYECITFKIWKTLTNEQRKKYIDWIEKQNLDHYDYSLKTHEGDFLKEVFKGEINLDLFKKLK